MIVAIEGVDCAGKATVTDFLADYLTKINVQNTKVTFPRYDGPCGKIIKSLLKDPSAVPELKQAVMLADRLGAIDLLKQGEHEVQTVICDRYVMSGIIYGLADGLDEPWLYKMHATLPVAHLQLLLDIDPVVAAQRRDKPRDANETNFRLLNNVRQLYLNTWNTYMKSRAINNIAVATWKIIDASLPIETIKQQVTDAYHEATSAKTFLHQSFAAY